MKLRCLASGSSGNCYLLETESECLILDCGVPIKDICKALDFNVSKIVGVVVTHSHKDHSLYADELEFMGIPVFKPYEKFVKSKLFGKFVVIPFDCKHNVPCYGLYISHPDMGRMIYATDTCYVKYRFSKLNHILIECNWSKKYVDTYAAKYRHELEDHMEQETCMEFLRNNVSDTLQDVILCHLSQSAIDAEECVAYAKTIVNKAYVDYARKGLEIELTDGNRCPFE